MAGGFTKFIKNLFGSKQDRDVATYEPIVQQVNEVYNTLQGLSNDELRGRTTMLRGRINEYLAEIDAEIERLTTLAEEEADFHRKDAIYKKVDELKKNRDEELEVVLKEILPEAFATVKEAARRLTEDEELRVTATQADRDLAANEKKDHIRIEGDTAIYSNKWTAAGGEIVWKMVHYDVQLIGGMALHEGKIAEMQTGEGKTLVATLPAYLNGLSGQGVHVITVNDYLARRDAEWIGPLMEFLQLSINCIDYHRPNSPGRRAAYQCDIVYGTNNEFGFDYLRDNMVRNIADKTQGKHHYAMIDEVDSVLIDDARTPLIISGPVTGSTDDRDYEELKPHIEKLVAEQQRLANKFLTQAKKLAKEGYLGVEDGEAGFPLLRAYRALPNSRPLTKFLSEDGIRTLLQKTENTFMAEKNKRMPEVDAELLFTIDAKNKQVDLTPKGVEYLSRYNQDPEFFIMPNLATDMAEVDNRTDISDEEKSLAKNKIAQDFGVKSKRLHAIRQLLKAYTLFTIDDDYVVQDGQVKIVDVQTGRMMEGRRYSDGLHQALESKENVKIGEITQTYATVTLQNFFRMYHKLAGMTGTAETEAGEFWDIYKLDVVVIPTNRPIQRDDRNDLIYKTEREKFNAVVNDVQEITQAGRPVLVGTTSVEISEKLSRYLRSRGIEHNVLNAKQHQREADIVAEAGRPGQVTIATNMAGRGTDIKLSDEVKQAGGLAIIGTERHDSRRVDRQLRGRSGRQGDPGSSQFYVSLEDRLMRYFQSERISKWMDRAGHKEGDVIQAGIVTKSIENAQKKVEENAFGTRKRLLEYDDVMNIQREAIYRKRDNALSGKRLALDIHSMFEGLLDDITFQNKQNGDFDSFRFDVLRILGFETKIDAAFFKETKEVNDIADRLLEEFQGFYHSKMLLLVDRVMPHIRQIQEDQPGRYKRIVIPFTDGSTHPLAITADIEKAIESNGRSIISDIEQTVTLAIIDDNWKEHLRSMDELKTSTNLASFEQKDPLVIYKMEAYKLFEGLIRRINETTTAYLAKGDLVLQRAEDVQEAKAPTRQPAQEQVTTNKREAEAAAAQKAADNAGQAQRQKVETFQRKEAKVKRNDPCPCGSGKKFKQCHGK
ncbi:preprotein translocase subunit SecA [Lewinella sp. 4G2]|uniref:preprotein translocase subunit SecA n=1 Tax=Lewinella sp. 4G2 TaxID=1803372 RepID=UPI0007B48E44|nr:preprotein translocase subunit SecA [Lewinella sp. 4G2]OAV43468.1 preprotein translocase subunit SecA [Lewinella sp. 4G2]